MTILREDLQTDSYFPIVFPVAWGRSSAGRALDWQSRGQGFDPPRLHHSTSHGLRIRGPFCYQGLMAQRLAQGTHNPWVAGSNPAGPTMHIWPGGTSSGPFAFQLFQLCSQLSQSSAFLWPSELACPCMVVLCKCDAVLDMRRQPRHLVHLAPSAQRVRPLNIRAGFSMQSSKTKKDPAKARSKNAMVETRGIEPLTS